MRRQIERLLNKLDALDQEVGRDRAQAVLEYTATPEAEGFLKALASGSPDARLTQQAKSALDCPAKRAALLAERCVGGPLLGSSSGAM
jgi:hypothetical protein